LHELDVIALDKDFVLALVNWAKDIENFWLPVQLAASAEVFYCTELCMEWNKY
jgi:hypothetical protein